MSVKILDENVPILKATGLYRWIVDGGYDGSLGGNMLTFERPPILPNMGGQVDALQTDKYPLPPNANSKFDAHAYFTTHAALQFAPGAKITSVTDYGETNPDGWVTGDLHDVTIPWIMNNKPLSAFKSQNLEAQESDAEFGEAAKFCAFCAAAGNNGQAMPTMGAASWWGIGAVELVNGQWLTCSCSAQSNNVDFVFPGAYYLPTTPGMPVYLNGTSFAAPAAAGTVKVIQHFFISKIGRSLMTDELYSFLQSCCLDLGRGGYDPQFGWGLPVLPPYDLVDLSLFETGVNPTTDLPPPASDHDAWADSAVAWAVANGVFHGDGVENYRWRDCVTRQELAQILHNIYGRE